MTHFMNEGLVNRRFVSEKTGQGLRAVLYRLAVGPQGEARVMRGVGIAEEGDRAVADEEQEHQPGEAEP